MELFLATRNRAKAREMARLLVGETGPGSGEAAGQAAVARWLRVRTLDEFPDAPDPAEDADTFAGNALAKARSAADHTGMWAVADDSGLAVAWLGGKPGVLSARYCGRHGDDVANNLKVLAEMSGVPEVLRGARFMAAVAIAAPAGDPERAGRQDPGSDVARALVPVGRCVTACREWVVEGECHGMIGYEMRGNGGFGYDSLFLVPHLGKTFAELAPAEKDALSHRGKAFAKARVLLARLYAGQTTGTC